MAGRHFRSFEGRRGRNVLRLEGSSLLVSRGARPWQGCILQVWRQRCVLLDPCGFAWRVVTFIRRAKPWQGRALEGSGGRRARVDARRHARARAPRSTRTSGGACQPTPKNAHTPTHTNQYTCVHSLARLHEQCLEPSSKNIDIWGYPVL